MNSGSSLHRGVQDQVSKGRNRVLDAGRSKVMDFDCGLWLSAARVEPNKEHTSCGLVG